MTKKWLILFCCLMLLTGCKQNPAQEELFGSLISHFHSRGFSSCMVEKLEEGDREVPIYNASVWYRLLADGEELLVYFDESNRADYLLTLADTTSFTCAGRFGLRFIVLYAGSNSAVIDAIQHMPL